jgi:hypothetical protein
MFFDDPVILMSVVYFVVLFLLALWPSRGKLHDSAQVRRPKADVQAICKLRIAHGTTSVSAKCLPPGLGGDRDATVFPELESSWFPQCLARFSQAIERISLD